MLIFLDNINRGDHEVASVYHIATTSGSMVFCIYSQIFLIDSIGGLAHDALSNDPVTNTI